MPKTPTDMKKCRELTAKMKRIKARRIEAERISQLDAQKRMDEFIKSLGGNTRRDKPIVIICRRGRRR